MRIQSHVEQVFPTIPLDRSPPHAPEEPTRFASPYAASNVTEPTPPLITPEAEAMEGVHDTSTVTTPPIEVNRGMTSTLPDPTETDDEIHVTALHTPRIVSTTPGRGYPTPSRKVLFNIPHTTAYVNLASAERLAAEIMSQRNTPRGELPSMGEIPLCLTTISMPDDTYPGDFDFHTYIKRTSRYNGIPYHYATFGPNHQKTFVGLMHHGVLVQAGQLASLGRLLAQDHHC